jgi:MATE family multidrug resistance protein
MGLTDNLMLGWYDVQALAAATLAWSIFFTLFIVGSGFAFAVLPMVASAVAREDEVQMRRVTRMGMWISTFYGAAVMPTLIWSEPILLAIGQQPDISALAQDYLRIAAVGMIPALLVMVLKNYLAALERTQAILWITLGAAGLNALVNYALIFGNLGMPELGIRGAAIATVLMQIISLIALAIYINSVEPEHAMFQRLWRPDIEAFANVFRLGWPIGLTNLAESGLFAASALMMGWIGSQTLAAHGIAIQLASVTFMIHVGLSQAATVRAGHAAGHADGMSLRDGARAAIALSLMFAGVTTVLFLAMPEILIGLFLDPTDPQRPQIIATGVVLLALAAVFQLLDAAQVMALGLLRGLQDTAVPMIHAGVSYWVIGLPAGYAMGFLLGWGAVGIWLGLVVGLACASALLMARFWTRGVAQVPVKYAAHSATRVSARAR